MKVLVINAGSSSIKYQLFSMTTEKVIAKGIVERIGEARSRVIQDALGRRTDSATAVPDHAAALKEIVENLLGADQGVLGSVDEIEAIGHRVVHGGEQFTGSVLITEAVLDAIRQCVPLAPLHNPPNLTGIEAAQSLLPDVPHVAVFDTAFHQTMPPEAFVYAIPYELYRKHHIRRYGFHGTSHRYVAGRAAEMLGKPVEAFDGITVHLGNGCSMAAIRAGRSVDTSMGLTPLEGLVMGTRCGDIDPAIVFHLAAAEGLSLEEMDVLLNQKSGLLGLTGVSGDMRTVSELADKGDERARLALKVFAHRVRRYIGAFLAVVGRADAVVFTGGIGENAAGVRGSICQGLEGLGIRLDAAANAAARGCEADVSAERSPVRILVVPTNEELVIARDTAAIAGGKRA